MKHHFLISMNKLKSCDIVIIGGGMVGLSLAHQLIERKLSEKIIIIDKEVSLGKHSSGRNSGVLHAGIYYKPGTLKSKVCVEGSKRLKEWVIKRNLPINNCGKIIVPQKENLDKQIDELALRGTKNGADVDIWDHKQLSKFAPLVRSSTGRALWSPNTSVVKPITIINTLYLELIKKGVEIINLGSHQKWEVDPEKKSILINKSQKLRYSFFINCAGLQADRISHLFGLGNDYRLIPFKGLYWQIRENSSINIKSNIYPVPDLNVPFLGVHFTPGAGINSHVSIGPTATPALGRENYKTFESIEPINSLNNIFLLCKQYVLNQNGFRKYAQEQLLLSLFPLMLKSARELIPSIRANDIESSDKVGIRSQLFNLKTQKLEDDFLYLENSQSLHILNAISPAFTASFALADLIINKSKYLSKRN